MKAIAKMSERELRQELRTTRLILGMMIAADGDHMTACDKTMGATHPCTCGANMAREYFRRNVEVLRDDP